MHHALSPPLCVPQTQHYVTLRPCEHVLSDITLADGTLDAPTMNSFLTHNTLPYHQPAQMHQMMMPEPKYSPPDDYGNMQNYMGSPDFFGSPHHHHHHHQHHHPHHGGNHHNQQQSQHGSGGSGGGASGGAGGGSVGVSGHQQAANGVVGVQGASNAVLGGGGGGHYQGHYQQQIQAMYPSPGQTPSYYTSAAPNYGAYQMQHNGHIPLEAQQPPAALMHNTAAQQCQGGSIPTGAGGVGGLAAAINAVMPHDIKDDSSPSPLPCHLQPSPSSSHHMSNNPLDGSCSDDMDDNTDTDEMMMTTVNGSPIMMDDSESSDRVIYPWMKKNHVAGMRKSILFLLSTTRNPIGSEYDFM